jgi:hypothetical protein
MRFIRPQFSLRFLLIGFVTISLLLYAVVVRPTVIADRFIRAIEKHDYKLATSMLDGHDENAITSVYTSPAPNCEAIISPRTWADVRNFRRTITVWAHVSMKHRTPSGKDSYKTIYSQKSTFQSDLFRVRLIDKDATMFL